jgi:hypothetical protein
MVRLPVLLLTGLLAAAVPAAASHAQTLNDPAQWSREHARAVAANDPANDPDNPASSNALNLKQLHKAERLGDGPAPALRHRLHHD